MSPRPFDHPRWTLAAFALIILIGGTNGVAVRMTTFEMPPFLGAAVRFSGAALLFGGIMVARQIHPPRGRALLGVVLFGVLNFGASYALIYWGIVAVPAGLTQVVIALAPLMTIFLARVHGLESFNWRGLLGAGLAVTGIAVAFGGQLSASAPLAPLLSIVAGTLCVAESNVIAKQFPGSDAIAANAISMAIGVAILVALSLAFHEPWTLPATLSGWAALAYLVVVGAVVLFVLFRFLLGRLTASTLSYQFVLFPFVTVLVAAALLSEPITPALVLGGALVLIGVWVGALTR